MSVLYLVAVCDVKAGSFLPPMAVAHVQVAMRSFEQEVNRDAPDNMIAKYPEDFHLYKLGTFNQVTGDLEQEHELLCKAVNVQKKVV